MPEHSSEDLSESSTGVTVKPVVNAIRILRFLTASGSPARAADIARELAINPSTCFNTLRTLVAEEMLDFDPLSKTYTTGLGLAKLVEQLVTQGQRLEIVRPLMQEFAAAHHVTVTLWRRMGNDRIVLVSSETSPGDLRIDMAIGQRLPLLMGASGRLFTARLGLDEERLRAVFDKVRWARSLGYEEYRRQVADASTNGWSVDDGYFSAGILAVAAPVNDRAGAIAYAVSAVTFRGQHGDAEIGKLGQSLCRTAAKVGNILF
ncbi:IclR family transcriptional regulator [Pseudoduganella umbonata]|uniref:IclR family transcriptional regulator n=1 Tax=Pseudoduganella umbonata TaxID=864828 RepID=A0A4P8HK46_9BURK|nr:IclR family transcriptional regulator [Pseudoduganella umbonata]MBB3219944.1 DNA-binding IclR family transcriptional regulator [Pseudoduganella umbonata]QCP09957.1 IclR family transcriptional regulator [Pseudoduganella umbonata]